MPDIDPPFTVSRSTLYFVVLFVGACIMMASAATWFVFADKDYSFQYSHASDDPPPSEYGGKVGYYNQLSPEQREMFHEAVEEGKTFRVEDKSKIPQAEAIYRDSTDKYYYFDRYAYYDWLDPMTGGLALSGLFGLGLMIDAARRDFRRNRL
jgi:hypothetical protein